MNKFKVKFKAGDIVKSLDKQITFTVKGFVFKDDNVTNLFYLDPNNNWYIEKDLELVLSTEDLAVRKYKVRKYKVKLKDKINSKIDKIEYLFKEKKICGTYYQVSIRRFKEILELIDK